MTKEEMGKLAIELLQAELDGKQIECKTIAQYNWVKIDIITESYIRELDFMTFSFRIKPEKKLVPFTWEDRVVLLGNRVQGKNINECYEIIGLDEEGISFYFNSFTYEELLSDFTFLDGSPCGKEVEK